MHTVLRNNEYLETEILLFGDVVVPQKPHEQAVFVNGEWLIDTDTYFSKLDKSDAEEFLKNTDWKIIRHKEQQDLGIQTSLTDEEYLALITERQERRNILNDITN